MEEKNIADLGPQDLSQIALERATLFTFFNIPFRSLTDKVFVQDFLSGSLNATLDALVDDFAAQGDIATGASLILAYFQVVLGSDVIRLTEELGVDRTLLYRGVTPGYGPPPPYEAVWIRKADEMEVLQAIAKIYRQYDLEPTPDGRDRIDYVGLEMDFMRELATREANAWQASDAQSARDLLASQQDFFSQHLGAWLPAFIEKALEHAQTDFYRGHLLMMRGFIAYQRQQLEQLVISFAEPAPA